MIKKFIFYWRTGTLNIGEGLTPEHAFTNLGYGAGAVAALDFHEQAEKPNYSWDKASRNWVVPPT